LRAVLDQQCIHFHGAASDITADTARSLFSLDEWAQEAARLIVAMQSELDAGSAEPDQARPDPDTVTYQFALSIAVVRRLQLDPLLPAELLPKHWPGQVLRSSYHRFDEAFKRRLNNAFRQGAD
jgi:phenylacetic acid degradation operon negative regulatory protein